MIIEVDEGFEPPDLSGPPVFKTGAIDHSANLPKTYILKNYFISFKIDYFSAIIHFLYFDHLIRIGKMQMDSMFRNHRTYIRASCWDQTNVLRITSALLYHLS